MQQAAFDDCVYAVDVMRNVAVKQGANQTSSVKVDPVADDIERKFSLPARMLCQTSAALLQSRSDSQQDSSQAPAVAGRLEIRMVDQSSQLLGDCATDANAPALYQASAPAIETSAAEKSVASISTHHSLVTPGLAPNAPIVSTTVAEEVSVFYDAQPTGDEETFRTALFGGAGTCKTVFLTAQGGVSIGMIGGEQETERLEVIPNDDDNESLHSREKTSRISSARASKSPQRRIGTVVPPISPRLETTVDSGHYRDETTKDADGRKRPDVAIGGGGETEEDEDEEDEQDEEDEDEDEEEEEEDRDQDQDQEGEKHDDDNNDGDAVDDEQGNRRPSQDYQVLSEQLDEERRKISVINLNDLSAAFQASSRMRTPRHSPPPVDLPSQQRRFSQDERSHAVRLVSGYLSQMTGAGAQAGASGEEEEASGGEAAGPSMSGKGLRYDRDEETSSGRRKRQGVEKYVSDNSQLNLQFERRRSHRPQSSDMTGLTVVHHSPTLRHRSSVATAPDTAYTSHSSYMESRSRPSPQSTSSLSSTYEISRVRSSPSLVPSTSRFPFHYTPHPPTGNPPTLRELDAR